MWLLTLSSTWARRTCIPLPFGRSCRSSSCARIVVSQEVHVMGPADYPSCQRFGYGFDQRCVEDPRFCNTVLHTEETLFTCERTINSLNNFKEKACRKDFSSVFCAVLLTVDPRMLDRTCPQRPSAEGTTRSSGDVLLEVR
jgi:hypothetical protein